MEKQKTFGDDLSVKFIIRQLRLHNVYLHFAGIDSAIYELAEMLAYA